jgi:hypothetical protein
MRWKERERERMKNKKRREPSRLKRMKAIDSLDDSRYI